MLKKLGFAMCVLGITGCGGGDKLVEEILDIDTKNDYQFINASTHEYDFYLKNKSDSEIYEDKYKEASLTSLQAKKITFESNVLYTTYIAIEAPNVDGIKNMLDHHSENKKTYNVVAWDNSGLVFFKQKESNVDNEFRVRFFKTHDNLKIKVDGTPINLDYKDVSDFYTIKNCETSITAADHNYSICNQDLGNSYLMVLNNDGTQIVVHEK
ncbi:hypothetical protein [Pseudoalteromonas denitrificans]|uniref:Lipoprotein n=1 Tax=Pseudoalteromonas denitrificans DSM 6059 TaxID=1123010 RepID=A0A1I1TY48_9GAMM|nr:hypothetical protein [Pseudoalteromonas denitrificans]SFD63409.1 hypothetical protein SAMN02745724_05041 [Pseudoalteromonas denitrificans DSM 6059]